MRAAISPESVRLDVELGGLHLAHPLVDASGTFDLLEYARRFDGDYFACFPYAAVRAQDGHRGPAHRQPRHRASPRRRPA